MSDRVCLLPCCVLVLKAGSPMEKIDKNLLRRYLEHGGDAGVRERLREWFLEHDAEGGIYPAGRRSRERGAVRLLGAFAATVRAAADARRALPCLAGRLFGRKLRLQRLWRRLSQAAAVLLVPLVVCAYLFASRQVAEQPEWVEVYAPYGRPAASRCPTGAAYG